MSFFYGFWAVSGWLLLIGFWAGAFVVVVVLPGMIVADWGRKASAVEVPSDDDA